MISLALGKFKNITEIHEKIIRPVPTLLSVIPPPLHDTHFQASQLFINDHRLQR